MKETNLKPSPRLLGRCCLTDFLYSKATLMLLIFMLPLVSIAQERNSKAKEANYQEYLQSIYGNQRDGMQITEGKTKVKQLTEAQKELQLQQLENENLRAKLESAGVNVQKYLNAGYTLQQTLDEFENPQTKAVKGGDILFRSGGGDTCADAVVLECGVPAIGDSYDAYSAGVTMCGGSPNDGSGMWYKFTGNGAMNSFAITASTGASAQIRIYTSGDGSCSSLQCASISGQGTTSISNFFAPFEDTIYVLVSSFLGNGGTYTLERTSAGECFDTPPGDGLSSETPFIAECGNVYTGDTTDFGNTEVGRVDCSNNISTGSVGVWYKINVTANYPAGTGVTLDLCGSGFDTEVNVYQGAALDCVGYNDDSFSNCGSGGRSYFEFDAQPNTDYYIYIAGWSSSSNGTGPYEMSVLCDGIAPPPPPQVPNNDTCPTAIELACDGISVFGNSTLATDTGNPGYCGVTSGDPTVWYSYSGDAGLITVSLCGDETDFDTYLSLFTGDCNALICEDSNDDFCGSRSQIQFTADGSTVYYIAVSGFFGASGNYQLDVTCDLPPTIPDNDLCADAEPLVCGNTYEGNTLLATATGAPTEDCSEYSQTIGAGVWYTYEGDGQIVTLTLCDSPLDTKVLVLTGSCGALSCHAGNDDECGVNSFRSEVTFSTVIGETYYVYVTGYGGGTGEYIMEVTCQADPCLDATLISCSDGTVYGDNIGGSTVSPEYCGTTAYAPGVFYELIGEGKFVNINTCGSALDTSLNVYSGACGALECLTGNGDWSESSTVCGEPYRSNVNFFANEGESYFIWVSGWSNSEDTFVLNLSCLDAVDNDLCEDAIALQCDTTVTGSTTLATDRGKPEEDCSEFDQSLDAGGVWYTLEGTGGDVRLSLCESGFDTKLLVLTGECGDFECYAGNDDNFAACGSGFRSELTMATEVGETYYVYVSGYGTTTGDFTLEVDCLCAPSQEGPECVTIYDGYDDPNYSTGTLTGVLEYANEPISYLWSTGETTESITVEAGDGTQNYSVTMTDAEGCSGTQEFFVYVMNVNCDTKGTDKVEICHNGVTICVAPSAVQSHIDHGDVLGACGNGLCDAIPPLCDITINSPANGDTDVSVYPSVSWTEASGLVDGYSVIVYDENNVEVASEDAGLALSAAITTELDYETTYTITVVPYNSNGNAEGCSLITITTEAEGEPGDGFTPQTAFAIACGGQGSGTTPDPNTDDSAAISCNFSSTGVANGAWFTFTGTGSTMNINTVGSYADTKLHVYSSNDGGNSLTCVGTNDDISYPSVLQSRVEFTSTAGQQYFAYVSSYDSASFPSGPFVLNVDCTAARIASSGVKDTADWAMSPNPTRGNVTLNLGKYVNENVTVEILDFSGIPVKTMKLNVSDGENYNVQLNRGLRAGIYFVKVTSGMRTSTKKLMIMN